MMRRDGLQGSTRDTGPDISLALAAAHRSDIAPFIVMDVMRAAAAREAAGQRVIHMEVGQPATPAPKSARDRVMAAMNSGNLGYTVALGMPELRAAIAGLYKSWYGLDIDPARIVVTSGSSAAFVLAFLALFDIGTTVGLPSPGYPCYRHILTALGVKSHLIETTQENRWMPSAAQIGAAAQAHKLKGLLLASPNNPTGTMLSPERLAEVADMCRARGMWFISDEIYHGLTWGIQQDTALRYSPDAIVINSFSKYFSMTGWRVGWMVVPEQLIRTVERLAQNLYICPPTISQVAALGAFDGIDELEDNRRIYAANRELLLAGLPQAGLGKIVPADGAFYIYADVGDYTSDSLAFTKQMLDETGVAATPGLDFDPARGGRFVRFSYAGATSEMAEAVQRLQGWARVKAQR